MIELGNISFLSSWVLDVILILISASACFYCALLSKRLKALNGLDSGVGASIVSLTDAIGKTHDAAREAQSATHETVETLRFLLDKCESMAPNIEASISELESQLKAARKIKTDLQDGVMPELETAAQRGRVTATGLLKIVEAVKTQQDAQEKALKLQSLKQKALKKNALKQKALKQEAFKQKALAQDRLSQDRLEQDSQQSNQVTPLQKQETPVMRPVLVKTNPIETAPSVSLSKQEGGADIVTVPIRHDGQSAGEASFASNLSFLTPALKTVNS